MKTLLSLAGEESPGAKVNAYYEMWKTVSKSALSPAELMDINKIYNPYTMEELKALFPAIELDGLLADAGYKQTDTYIVNHVGGA